MILLVVQVVFKHVLGIHLISTSLLVVHLENRVLLICVLVLLNVAVRIVITLVLLTNKLAVLVMKIPYNLVVYRQLLLCVALASQMGLIATVDLTDHRVHYLTSILANAVMEHA